MAIIIEAPEEIYSRKNNDNLKLFLAGGITNVPDWQSKVIERLNDIENLTIYNPRRKAFDVEDKNIMEQQIVWEYNHLRDADIISFWFAKETLNPITLYELGKWANATNKQIVIGIEPEYARKDDVIIQTNLARPEIKYFHSSVNSLSEELRKIISIGNSHNGDEAAYQS